MTPRAAVRPLLAATALALAAAAGAQDGDWEEVTPRGEAGNYPVQVEAEPTTTVTLESFQSGLSPYGDWVQSGTYGTVWRPRVAGGWRPYYYGRWEWTNEGWFWVSEEPFGWATYHYGRWAWDGGAGWVWVPGYQWAPAWVSWRYGADAVGWAPLAPGLSLYVTTYAFADFWWTFVPSVRFCGSPVWGVAYPPSRAWQYYGATSPAPPRPRPPVGAPGNGRPPPPMARQTPGWGGPPPRYIEERSGRPVQASRIVAEPHPGAARGRPGEVGVYRPERAPPASVPSRPAPAARPMSPAQPLPPSGRSAPPAAPGARSSHSAAPWAPSSQASPGGPRPGGEPGRSTPPAARPSPAPATSAPHGGGGSHAPSGGGSGGGRAPSGGGGTGGGHAPSGGGHHQVSGGGRQR